MNILTVAILSYNRPIELLRCLESLLPLPIGVKVEIYDDASPLINDICNTIAPFLSENPEFKISISNENIGYDANLLNSIVKSKSDYVMLLSDDDYLEAGCLNSILSSLLLKPMPISFVRYCDRDLSASWNPPPLGKGRRDFGRDMYFDGNYFVSNGSILYNSILFSGLIFKREEVCKLFDKLTNYDKSIYIQVAIFSYLTKEFGVNYIHGPGIIACADGINGFGTNSASNNNSDLIDRSTIHSNLKYNKRLIKVIDSIYLDLDLKSGFIYNFFSEFNFRNFSGMRYARKMGRSYLVEYWKDLGEVTRYRSPKHWAIFFTMFILPLSLNTALSNIAYKVASILRRGR